MLVAFASAIAGQPSHAGQSYIWTVTGKVPASQMGLTLSHEHVMSNFGGDTRHDPDYDEVKLVAQVEPYLEKMKALGAETIVDCTTAWFGRDVRILRELSQRTGVNIVTNTGYYAAAKDRYVPPSAYEETVEQIAARWIQEFETGIDDTGIRPGFIKLGFDHGPPSEIDLKLFRSGLLAHKATGLTIAVHTGANVEAAQMQLDMLDAHEISPSSWIWTHANKMGSVEPLIEAARKGAWISLDGVRQSTIENHLSYLQAFKDAQLLDHILLSHDGNSFPRGGAIRSYEAIFTHLIPAMQASGFSETEINSLLVENPRRTFALLAQKE